MAKPKKKATAAKAKTKAARVVLACERAVETANAVPDVLAPFAAFRSFQRNDLQATLTNCHACDLSESTRAAIIDMFEQNMRAMYETSDWGYDPEAKRKELFEDEARYLLAYRAQKDSNELLAFVHFRFVVDDDVEVLYVYEIQVARAAQRRGLGKFLMQVLLLVARQNAMQLVVLTVFKANAAAMRFYRSTMGFAIDETSPSANGDDSQSFEILSKPVPPPPRRAA